MSRLSRAAVVLAALLASLAVVWFIRAAADPGIPGISRSAQVGEGFFYAAVGTQLVLVLLAAPASTAGATRSI